MPQQLRRLPQTATHRPHRKEAIRKVRRAAAEWIRANPGSRYVKPSTRLSVLADICSDRSHLEVRTFPNGVPWDPTQG